MKATNKLLREQRIRAISVCTICNVLIEYLDEMERTEEVISVTEYCEKFIKLCYEIPDVKQSTFFQEVCNKTMQVVTDYETAMYVLSSIIKKNRFNGNGNEEILKYSSEIYKPIEIFYKFETIIKKSLETFINEFEK